jgi:hypothetical protein
LLEFCKDSRLALLLCGNSQSLASRKRETKQAMEQLRQRLLHSYEIGLPSAADCREIGTNFDLDGIPAYQALASFGTRLGFHHMDMLLTEAKIQTGGEGRISRQTLENALLSKVGVKSLHLLSPNAAHLAEISEETGSPKRIAKTA